MKIAAIRGYIFIYGRPNIELFTMQRLELELKYIFLTYVHIYDTLTNVLDSHHYQKETRNNVKRIAIVAALFVLLVLLYGRWEMSKPILMNIDGYGTHLKHSWTMKPFLSLNEEGKYWSDEFVVARSWILFWKGPVYYQGKTNGYMEAPMKLTRCQIVWQYKNPDDTIKHEPWGEYKRYTQVIATTKGCLEVPWAGDGRSYHLMMDRTGDTEFVWKGKKMITNRLYP